MSGSHGKSNSNLNDLNTRRFVIALCLIALIILGFYFGNFQDGLSSDNGVWGTFGDYVGWILNPLIAAFAFYLIARTYELQKNELEATRKLLEASTDAQKDQIKLAALTALLNSNLETISLLESEKLLLLESNLRNPPPSKEVEMKDLMRKALTGQTLYEKHIKSRSEDIQEEIKCLKNKNLELETEIKAFLN